MIHIYRYAFAYEPFRDLYSLTRWENDIRRGYASVGIFDNITVYPDHFVVKSQNHIPRQKIGEAHRVIALNPEIGGLNHPRLKAYRLFAKID